MSGLTGICGETDVYIRDVKKGNVRIIKKMKMYNE
jgi:hypothetical protein